MLECAQGLSKTGLAQNNINDIESAQDWDFPHFVCDLNIKLPGLHAASFKYHMFQKYVHLPEIVFHISGKWFNYGIIVVVMLLDLNMWKNQIFYQPEDYGQYTGFDNKVRTVVNYATLALQVTAEVRAVTESSRAAGNRTLWTLEYRLNQLNPATNRSLAEEDILMNSRYLGYPLSVKGLAFLPSLLGFAMFGLETRFTPPVATASIGGQPARLVVCWDARCGQTSASKALLTLCQALGMLANKVSQLAHDWHS
ncbi:hypothetical protein HPB52_024650 [Rhipicephalus sanguineus]|uniref:Uncharacterized protein n=1 Tax=Rhipicephalus sanguineus TaxID=34632 RepID=A0A9D4TE44_RHISA|nr:hypothetical protein HPB52_024650 [Rhipicephalus sanguineus]